jgi:hypothetical protein
MVAGEQAAARDERHDEHTCRQSSHDSLDPWPHQVQSMENEQFGRLEFLAKPKPIAYVARQ